MTIMLTRDPSDTSLEPSTWDNAYLIIDPDGSVHVTTRLMTGGDMTPMEEAQMRRIAICIDSSIDGDVGVDDERLLADLDEGGPLYPLLRFILDGWTIEWDGNNHVGRFTDDAHEAMALLDEMISAYDDYLGNQIGKYRISAMDPWLWATGNGQLSPADVLDGMNIPLDDDDETIEREAALWTSEMRRAGYEPSRDVADTIRRMIEEAREEQEEDDE